MRTLSQALFLSGCAKVPFFSGFPLRERCGARAGVSGAARRCTATVRANAVILVAKSALSVCSSAQRTGVQRCAGRISAHQDQDRLDGDDRPQRRQVEPRDRGISRRIGRSTGSLKVVSSDCSGE